MTALLEVVHDRLVPRAQRRPTLAATVRRSRLFTALVAADAPPFTVIVAPAGFGKTTLLCEWAARDPRPFAWLTVDARHDEPRMLLRAIARAVDAAAKDAPDGRVVLVLDDVHVLRSSAAHATLGALTSQLPDEIAVAFASRSELPVPIARLRAQGRVSELRAAELAMTRTEASALLRFSGLQLDRAGIDALLYRTEGWPAALALAAIALEGETVPGPAPARFSGSDRIVAEYLRDEVLAGLSDEELRFAIRTSVLEVLTAPLCDAVLETSGSAELLTRLHASNFGLVALDRTAERYRHHRLLRDTLRAELRRSEPELEAALHRRASAWHVQEGDRERGLQHALAAHEVERAGDLVWSGIPSSLEQGSVATVEHWLGRFTDAQIAADPRLALAAAGIHLAHGRGHLAEHWLAAAGTNEDDDVAGGVAALRAALGRDGLARMGEDAERASALLAAENPCQALCRMVGGVADHLRGRREAARDQLEEGARRAAVLAPQVHALCLAQLALLALDDDDSEGAVRLITRARAQVTRYGLARYPTTALALAVSALVRAQRGRVEEAHEDAREAAEALEQLTDVAPWYVIEVQILLGRAALRLSDVNDARTRLADASRMAARLPERGVLHDWLQAAEADLATFTRADCRLPASLTTAELRILQYLPTHLSFREIAERTYVSANTVKTQANAVYRKLDVRSRSEAVSSARELGLLDA